jgi:hypothetical protein
MLMGRPQLGLKPKLAAFENNASKHHRHARLPAHKSFKPLHATISPIPPSIRIASFEPMLVCFIAQTIRGNLLWLLFRQQRVSRLGANGLGSGLSSKPYGVFGLIFASSWERRISPWMNDPNHAMNDRRSSA